MLPKFTLISLFFAASVSAQILPADGDYNIHISTPLQKSYTLERDITYRFRKMGTDDSGRQRIQCELIGFGDDAQKVVSVSSQYQLMNLMLLNRPYDIVVDKTGNIIRQTGVDEIISAKLKDWELTPVYTKAFEELKGGGTRIETRGLLEAVYYSSLAKGQRWWNKDSTASYIVTPVTDKTSLFSAGEEWCTMMVKTSRLSSALFKGTAYDTSKVNALFRKYDPLFIADINYRIKKLGIIQSLTQVKGYEEYESELAKIPTDWIATESHHLHNKLQQTLAESTDSSLVIIRYLSKYPSYAGWMQHSMAQYLNQDERDRDELKKRLAKDGYSVKKIDTIIKEADQQLKNSRKLIDLLSKDPDTLIADAAYPMWLWSKTLESRADTSLLLENAKSIGRLKAAHYRKGNGYRYSLLLYKQLLQAGKTQAASDLLGQSINGLEKEASDNANADRSQSRNLLAYAWNLKYEQAQRTKDTGALRYLGNAAAYSPRGADEKAYASFYDRALLKSKESYQSDYANALIVAGDEHGAIRELAELVNADPKALPELKNEFEKHFPERSFGSFLNEVIINSWKTAPDFALKGTDGKIHQLSDYKGKWLLLDFWGTWCGPCVSEMPKIQALVNDLPKHRETAFLSIACRDTEPRVKSFLQSNGYSFPAAMSDNKVEKNYEVKGYPSKFLISPDGKMLLLHFNSDWKSAFENFRKFAEKSKVPVPAGKVKPVQKLG